MNSLVTDQQNVHYTFAGVRTVPGQGARLRPRIILRVAAHVAEGDRAGNVPDARVGPAHRQPPRTSAAGPRRRTNRSASPLTYYW